MKNLLTIILLISAIFIASCNESISDKLKIASQLSDKRPDSAYTILRNIDYNDLKSDSLKARYILTKALTNIRVGRSLITDTLLNDAATYYISVGDTSNWIIASQLLSGYDFIKGDSESALHRLEAMIPRIKNPELLWDTYIHLLELSINSQNYANAYNYADWLLRHTNVPEQILKFSSAKSTAQYMQGNYVEALALYDNIIDTGTADNVHPEIYRKFYREYAESLDAAGQSSKAIEVLNRLYENEEPINYTENLHRQISMAQFYANSGNTTKAKELLDSINYDATQSMFEVYAYIGMLKAALQFKESGKLPSDFIHNVTKNMYSNYRLAQFDRQTALESVIELNDDIYKLKIQRQRLWLLIFGISLLLIISGIIVYFILSRRKRHIIEAEERAETLTQMLKDIEKADKQKTDSSDSDKLKAALLRQLGIFKIFAGTPTQQSRDALKKISTVGKSEVSIESLVDWPEFYSMIDNLYNGFHTKLIRKYPDIFNDKEQQIIVLLKAGFSTKEISVLSEQTSATIYTRKSVIRKKLGTLENGDFITYLDEQIKAL
ncbi:MAG: hypothetical protein K2H47_04465 [Muribaculaceae bacterium]|nr:hypothetical protein [Muribaculaceae bacterium]